MPFMPEMFAFCGIRFQVYKRAHKTCDTVFPVRGGRLDRAKRVLVRWLRYDVIVLDEVGYVPLADIGAEFLFQVIAERAERAALVVTTTYRSQNGRRCFLTHGRGRRCWIASLTGRTSLRREQTRIVSAEHWRRGRKESLVVMKLRS
jgi:hypothetical protein